ncbi:hypothetical protein [Flavobacterium dankookense]|uniref:Uncharacterized protein n=1 Tax=Flavobacterium dankookense TaxID=706186 RepID=A0A4R6QEI5_9FLAO|nr:hypothetical protein [Flavobacterium dankookense]TDP61128.1 hypothetical protein BC748_0740 [Flavobacterium dankookense]
MQISLSAYAVAKGELNDTKLFITGDYSNQTFTGVYNTTNDTFTTLTQTNMIARRNHTSEIWQDKLFIFGGNTTTFISSCLTSTQNADLSALLSTAPIAISKLNVCQNPVKDILNLLFNKEITTA